MEDKDAGSGGGWNASLTLFANFSVIYPSHNECKNRTQPTGFSAHWSWIGGMPCNPQSNQYGGFGGGGGGCFGGGGGGGFIGKCTNPGEILNSKIVATLQSSSKFN